MKIFFQYRKSRINLFKDIKGCLSFTLFSILIFLIYFDRLKKIFLKTFDINNFIFYTYGVGC